MSVLISLSLNLDPLSVVSLEFVRLDTSIRVVFMDLRLKLVISSSLINPWLSFSFPSLSFVHVCSYFFLNIVDLVYV